MRASQDVPPAEARSPQQTARAAALSPWLQLMLAEIARQRSEAESGRAEAERRAAEPEAVVLPEVAEPGG